eukprot:scaffold58151_cov39-Attheya_sp.AAC.1
MVVFASSSNVSISPTCQDNIDYPECRDNTPDTINITVDCNTDPFVNVLILLYDDDLSAIGSSEFFDLPSQCNLPVGANSSNYCRYDYRLSCNPCFEIPVSPPGFNATTMPSLSPTTTTPNSDPTGQPTTGFPSSDPSLSPTTSFPSKDPTGLPTTGSPSLSPTTTTPNNIPTGPPTTGFPSSDP